MKHRLFRRYSIFCVAIFGVTLTVLWLSGQRITRAAQDPQPAVKKAPWPHKQIVWQPEIEKRLKERNQPPTTAGAESLSRPLGPCDPVSIPIGQSLAGQLIAGDCSTLVGDGTLADLYSFNNATAGQTVALSLNSTQFDAYLFLLDANGTVITQDDDGSGGTNARIPALNGFFTLPTTGTYLIVVNTFSVGQTGSYQLNLDVPLQYYPLAKPIRLYDTRATIPGVAACAYLNQRILNTGTLTRSAFVTCDGQTVPTAARAIVGNATIVNPTAPGHLTLWPEGQAQPPVSSLNYLGGQVVGNGFTVGLGASGQFRAFSVANTDLIIDVVGYYAAPATGSLYYHPLPKPIRLFDSRPTIPGYPACEYLGAHFNGNTDYVKFARITCEGVTIPANAIAVTGNLTAIGPGAAGSVTLWPSGTKPSTISLSYAYGQVIANNFTIGLDASGNFRLNTSTAANLVVDLTGYYSTSLNDINGTGLHFVPLGKPIRLYDTRAEIPGFPACEYLGVGLTATQTLTKQARISCNGEMIPPEAQAILGNAAVIGPAYAGHITIWPNGEPQPPVSNMNYLYGEVLANGFIVRLGADGQFRAFTVAPTNFVVDLTGYFAP